MQQVVDSMDNTDNTDNTDNPNNADSAESLEAGSALEKLTLKDESAESDPAAFLPFETHEDALNALYKVGYARPHQAPEFSSAGLVQSVNKLLESEGLLLMDMTDTLPVTPQAAFQALTVAAFNAAAATRKHEKAAFLIMRTQGNTPSFLFGHHWNLVQSFGKEMALQHVFNQPTPAAFVIFRDREIVLPSAVYHEEMATRLLAAEITKNPKYFCCELCGEGLVTHDDAGNITSIAEVAVTMDNRLFKRTCVEAHNERAMALRERGVKSVDVRPDDKILNA
tara:strand:+ start:163 stop:1005 length:843 start_codon:yes stop_codon:yes gene_type:complete